MTHQGDVVRFDVSAWRTDFSTHSVPLSEIVSDGTLKDGIPVIDRSVFESVVEAGRRLKPKEPVIFFEQDVDPRAYPLQILIWHEMVNDSVGGLPVTVTFCSLCNTAIVFDRRLDGRTLDFGITGTMRFSDMIMYDRQTESWWQQVTGEAIIGILTGKRLKALPAQIIAWEMFERNFPEGKALSRKTGHFRPYGRNPLVGYDDINSSPLLYSGPSDGRLRPMDRVVTVTIDGEDVAYPFALLQESEVINDVVAGKPIVVFFQHGVTSALDRSSIADSHDVGTAAVFERTVGRRMLTFEKAVGFADTTTGSVWSILGTATAGPLQGTRLTPIVSGQHFWFAWVAFKPHTRISGR